MKSILSLILYGIAAFLVYFAFSSFKEGMIGLGIGSLILAIIFGVGSSMIKGEKDKT